MEYWSIWYPKAAATGLLVARAAIDPAESVLLHAAPSVVTAEVSDQDGRRLAYGKDLARTLDSPMCRLARDGSQVTRADLWPGEADLGSVVLLPGGEAGILKAWWNAEDRRSWRWQVEYYNALD